MFDYRAALMTGIDIPIEECQLVIHQPSAKEISYLGDDKFNTGIANLTIDKKLFSQDKVNLDTMSNFQLFLMILNDETSKDKKQAVQEVLYLLFPKYNIFFMPRGIIFSQENSDMVITIDENNFDSLQFMIKQVFCIKEESDEKKFNAKSKKAKEIAEKIMRGRQKVAAIKSKEMGSLIQRYISTISVGMRLSPREVSEWTMFQIYDIMERFSLYTNWDIDIRSRLAGAKPEGDLPDWMANIHKEK